MAGSAILEKRVFTQFVNSKIYDTFGLLIGTSSITNTSGSDLIFLPIETPLKSDDDCDNNEIDNKRDSVCKTATEKCNETLMIQNDVKWISKHSLNIGRMLPGGFHILGIFQKTSDSHNNKMVNLGEDNVNNAFDGNWCLEVLKAIREEQSTLFTVLPCFYYLLMMDDDIHSSQIYNVNMTAITTPKLNGSIYSVENFIQEWRMVKTYVSLSAIATLPSERLRETIYKELKRVVRPFQQHTVNRALMLVNNKVVDRQALLFSCVDEFGASMAQDCNRSTKEMSFLDAGGPLFSCTCHFASVEHEVHCECYRGDKPQIKLSFVGEAYSNIPISFCENRSTDDSQPLLNRNIIRMKGHLPGVAFVHQSTSSVGHVEMVLKEDINRSLNTRLHLLSQELEVLGGVFACKFISLPQRILIHLPICSELPLSDYRFLSESKSEVLTRVRYFCDGPRKNKVCKTSNDSALDSGGSSTGDSNDDVTNMAFTFTRDMQRSLNSLLGRNVDRDENAVIAVHRRTTSLENCRKYVKETVAELCAKCIDSGLETPAEQTDSFFLENVNEPTVIPRCQQFGKQLKNGRNIMLLVIFSMLVLFLSKIYSIISNIEE